MAKFSFRGGPMDGKVGEVDTPGARVVIDDDAYEFAEATGFYVYVGSEKASVPKRRAGRAKNMED